MKELIKLAENDPDAARKVFVEKFAIDQVSFFDQYHNTDPNLGYAINPINQHLSIENFELMQNFLRTFGQFMSEVRVACAQKVSFKWMDMANLICTHCSGLKKLYLFNCIDCEDPLENLLRKAVRMENISRNPLRVCKAMPTLETLKIENIFLESTSMNLAELFPNLQTLDLITVGLTDPTIIERTMPKLEHLGIVLAKDYVFSSSDDEESESNHLKKLDTIAEEVPSATEETNNQGANKSAEPDNQFDCSNIVNALLLNPQLLSLELDMEMDIQFVDFINTTLPNLQKIKFSFGQDDFMDHGLSDDVVFKCVTDASLGILGIVSPPITFQQLKELYFATAAPQSIIYYIKRHKQLTSLHLVCEYSDEQAFTIVKALPDLEHLYLIIENHIAWTARGLMRLLAECERLNTVMLMVRVDSSDQRNWRTLIDQTHMWDIDSGYDKDIFTIVKIESDDN